MPHDPVGLAVFIALGTIVTSQAIFFAVRRLKFRSLYAPSAYALAYAGVLGGLVIVWAASTIDESVVPWIFMALGLACFAVGLAVLAVAPRLR